MKREHQSWYTNVICYIIGFNPYLKAEIETMQVLYLPYGTWFCDRALSEVHNLTPYQGKPARNITWKTINLRCVMKQHCDYASEAAVTAVVWQTPNCLTLQPW